MMLTNDEWHESLPASTLPLAGSELEAFTKAARTTMRTDYDCALAYMGARGHPTVRSFKRLLTRLGAFADE